MNENRPSEEKKAFSVSALPDFSQVYSFLQYFGRFFHLPPITLNELEIFFENEFVCTDSPVVYAHWKLLNNVCKREGKDRWQHMAVKFARRCEVVREMVLYSELTIEQRVKVFRLTCEEQFDSNAGFKLELKKQLPAAAMQWEPLGTDSDGQRHWMLRDSTFDVRLYGERGYDEVPPKSAVWEQLARSLEELAVYISKLEARWKTEPACTSDNESPEEVLIQGNSVLENCKKGFSELGDNCDYVRSGEERNDKIPARDSKAGRRLASKKSRSTGLKRAGKKEAAVMEEEVGCLKCHKDTNYKQMLLCDECDKECHMHCQYPVLWSVPRGKWICPLCKEKHLFANLKRLYSELSEARNHFERTMERKQRSIARLQKAGLHLQNIIDEGESDSLQRRSRRARKDVNYAELNDFYLPPLGHNDLVGSHNNCSDINTAGQARVTVGNDYGVPRIRFSRRLRGISREEDEREEEGGDSVTKEEESRDRSSSSASDKFESLEPDSLPESENEDDRDCLQTADGNEENEMDETSSVSTEVDDGCLNTFELRRGSGDLSIMVSDVDIRTGNDEGPTQPQTTSTLSRDKIFSLDLETTITTIPPVTESSTHSGM